MMSRLFWPGVAFLVAIIAHVAYVLYMPRLDMRERLDALSRLSHPAGAFRVLQGRETALLARMPLRHMLHGVCVIEPARGRVEMIARVPAGYWSLTVYSDSGDVIYTLNDRHVDADSLNVIFRMRRETPSGLPEVPRLREGKLVVPLASKRVPDLLPQGGRIEILVEHARKEDDFGVLSPRRPAARSCGPHAVHRDDLRHACTLPCRTDRRAGEHALMPACADAGACDPALHPS